MDTRNQRQRKHQPSPTAIAKPQIKLPEQDSLLTRKVLNDRYLIHRTIGEGRYAK